MKYLKLSDLRKASWYDVFGAEVEVWWHCHLKERTWCKLTTWLTAPLRTQTKLHWGLTCSQWSPQELAELLESIIGSQVGGLIFLNDQEELTKSATWNELLHYANAEACTGRPPSIPEVSRRGLSAGNTVSAQKSAEKR